MRRRPGPESGAGVTNVTALKGPEVVTPIEEATDDRGAGDVRGPDAGVRYANDQP